MDHYNLSLQETMTIEQRCQNLILENERLRGDAMKYYQIKAFMENDALAVVLLDLDGMIFRDELWSQGADGGRSAANELCEYIRLDLLSRGIPRNCKILCRGYVNLFGLAQSIHHNILGGAFDHDIHVVEDFLRGFTQARHLFDCVDVGRGHDAADIKLTENFKYYADDVRVKQIYFGGSHDNGYTRTLDQYAGPQYVNRVILLEGTPFACEIMRLPFRKVQFHGLFRESKMVNSGSTSTSRESSPQRWPYGMFVLPGKERALTITPPPEEMDPPQPYTPSPTISVESSSSNVSLLDSASHAVSNILPLDSASHAVSNVLPLDSASPAVSNISPLDPESPAVAEVGVANIRAREPLAADSLPIPSMVESAAPVKRVRSWAAKVAAPAPPAPVVQLPKASKAKIMKPVAIPQGPGGIYRNRDGQRIDPPTSKYSKAETDRVKKLKLCNVNYLRRDCPYGRRCTHDHDYKPTADELKTLALVARMAPCSSGSVCTDEKCVYGHMCAAPIKNGGKKVKGTKCCIFGEGCKFPAELHGIDGEVVKTTVVRN